MKKLIKYSVILTKMGFSISKNFISNLEYITSINIEHYLFYLSYRHIRNLSRTNKFFDKMIRDDKVIRNILSIKFNLSRNILDNKNNTLLLTLLPLEINVAQAMFELDNAVEKLIFNTYTTFPRWINVELFYLSMKKNIYQDLINELDYQYEESFDDVVINLRDNEYVSNRTLAFPYIADKINIRNSDSDVNTNFNLPESTVFYLSNLLKGGSKFKILNNNDSVFIRMCLFI